MRKLLNNVREFYLPKNGWMCILAIVFFGMGLASCHELFLPVEEQRMTVHFNGQEIPRSSPWFNVLAWSGNVALFGVGFLLLKQAFFPSPVCVAYPDKICVGKKQMRWEYIAHYLIWKTEGGDPLADVCNKLVLVPKDPGQEKLFIDMMDWTPGSQKDLLNELERHGVPVLPDLRDDDLFVQSWKN